MVILRSEFEPRMELNDKHPKPANSELSLHRKKPVEYHEQKEGQAELGLVWGCQ